MSHLDPRDRLFRVAYRLAARERLVGTDDERLGIVPDERLVVVDGLPVDGPEVDAPAPDGSVGGCGVRIVVRSRHCSGDDRGQFLDRVGRLLPLVVAEL